MRDRRDRISARRSRIEAIRRRHDEADRLANECWQVASDFRRWGLSREAAAAESRAIEARVLTIIEAACLAAAKSSPNGEAV